MTKTHTGTSEQLDEAILLAEQAAGNFQLAERKHGPCAAINSRHLKIAAMLTGLYLTRTALRCR